MLLLGKDYLNFLSGTNDVAVYKGHTPKQAGSGGGLELSLDWSANVTQGIDPVTVVFTNRSTSTIPWSSVVWDVKGDGSVLLTGESVQYTYPVGVYSPKMTLIIAGVSYPLKRNNYITVVPQPQVTLNTGFTISPSVGDPPLTITVTDTSSGNPIGTICEFDLYNDGNVDAVGSSATFTITDPGTYTVRQTIRFDGNSSILTKSFTVNAPPVVGSAQLSGLPRGTINVQSTNFTVVLSDTPNGTVVFTPVSDKLGTFSPATLSFNAGVTQRTFRFTPTENGDHTISLANSQGWTLQNTFLYTVFATTQANIDLIAENKFYHRTDPAREFGPNYYGSPPLISGPGSMLTNNPVRLSLQTDVTGINAGTGLPEIRLIAPEATSGTYHTLDNNTIRVVGGAGDATQRIIVDRVTDPVYNTLMAFRHKLTKAAIGWRSAAQSRIQNEMRYQGSLITWDTENFHIIAVNFPSAWRTFPAKPINLWELYPPSGSYPAAPVASLTFYGGGSNPTSCYIEAQVRGFRNGQAGVDLMVPSPKKMNPDASTWHWFIFANRPGHGVAGSTGTGTAPYFEMQYAYDRTGLAPWFRQEVPWGYPYPSETDTSLNYARAFAEHIGMQLPTSEQFETATGINEIVVYNKGIWIFRPQDRAGATMYDALESVRQGSISEPPPPPPPPPPPASSDYFNPTTGNWIFLWRPSFQLRGANMGPSAASPISPFKNNVFLQTEVQGTGVVNNVLGTTANSEVTNTDITKLGIPVFTLVEDPNRPGSGKYVGRFRADIRLGLSNADKQRLEIYDPDQADWAVYGERRLITLELMIDDVASWASMQNGDGGINMQLKGDTDGYFGNPPFAFELGYDATNKVHWKCDVWRGSAGDPSVREIAATYTIADIKSKEWIKVVLDIRCHPTDDAQAHFYMYIAREGTHTSFQQVITHENRWGVLNQTGGNLIAYYLKFGWYIPAFFTVPSRFYSSTVPPTNTTRDVYFRMAAVQRYSDVVSWSLANHYASMLTVQGDVVPPPTPIVAPTAAPTNVTASNVTATTFDFSCGSVANGTQYEVEVHEYIDAASKGEASPHWFGTTTYNGTSGTFTGLTAGQILTFRVRAKNSVGNGPWGYFPAAQFIATTYPIQGPMETMGVLTPVTTRITMPNGGRITSIKCTGAGGVFWPAANSGELDNVGFEDCNQLSGGGDSPLYVECNNSSGAGPLAYIHNIHWRRCWNPMKFAGGANGQNVLTLGRKVIGENLRFTGLRWPTNFGFPLAGAISIFQALVTLTKNMQFRYVFIDAFQDGYPKSTVEGDTVNINRSRVTNEKAIELGYWITRGSSRRQGDSNKLEQNNSGTLINVMDQTFANPVSTTPPNGSIWIHHGRFLDWAGASVGIFGGDGAALVELNYFNGRTPNKEFQTGNTTMYQQYPPNIANKKWYRNAWTWNNWAWRTGNITSIQQVNTIDLNPRNTILAANQVPSTGTLANIDGQVLTQQQLYGAGTGLTYGAYPVL